MTLTTKSPTPRRRYCRAVTWLKMRGTQYPVFPLRSLLGLAIALLCTCCVLVVVEIFIARRGGKQILSHEASVAWERENAIINANNRGKINQDPVWNSAGHPYRGENVRGKRILVLGDSFAWGDGNANMNYIWWRQLEWGLRRRGYWNIDVVSCGGRGGNTENAFAMLRDKKLVQRTGADLVIVGYVTNDPSLQGHPVRQLSGEPQARMSKAFRSKALDHLVKPILPNVAELLQERIVNKEFFRQPFGPDAAFPYTVWEYKLLSGRHLQLYGELVEQFGAYSQTMDAPLFFVTLPNYPNWSTFKARYRKVEPLFHRAGIPFHNILKAFVKKYPVAVDRRLWKVNPANGHPGPRSTHFYAEQTADILERDYADVLGSKVDRPTLNPRINDWLPHNLQVKQKDEHRWTITFPTDQLWMVTLPVGHPHILLSFEMPVAIRKVQLSGDALRAAALYVNALDPVEGFDLGKPNDLGGQNGPVINWSLAQKPFANQVTILRIAPAVDGERFQKGFRTFTLDIEFDEPGVRL